MRRSEIKHIKYALRVMLIVVPGWCVLGALGIVFSIAFLPIQVIAWLSSNTTFSETPPFSRMIHILKQYESWSDSFVGNPWIQ